MKTTIIMLLLMQLFSVAQGINFANRLTFAQIQKLAKSQHKNVLVNIYANWCGTCKFIADSMFTKEQVTSYMIQNFICYQVQLYQTPQDSPAIKAKYAEAQALVAS